MEGKFRPSFLLAVLYICASIHGITSHFISRKEEHWSKTSNSHPNCQHENQGFPTNSVNQNYVFETGVPDSQPGHLHPHIFGSQISDSHDLGANANEESRTFGLNFLNHFSHKPPTSNPSITGQGIASWGGLTLGGSSSGQNTGHSGQQSGFQQTQSSSNGLGATSNLHVPYPEFSTLFKPSPIYESFGSSGSSQWSHGSLSHGQNGFVGSGFGDLGLGNYGQFSNNGHGAQSVGHGGVQGSTASHQGSIHTQSSSFLPGSNLHESPNLLPIPGNPGPIHSGQTSAGSGTHTQSVVQIGHGITQNGHGIPNHPIPNVPSPSGPFPGDNLVPAPPTHHFVTQHIESSVSQGTGGNGIGNQGSGLIPGVGPHGTFVSTVSETSEFSASNSSSSSSSSSSSFSTSNTISSSSSSSTGGINNAGINTGNFGHGSVQNGAGLQQSIVGNHVTTGSQQLVPDVTYGPIDTETGHFQTGHHQNTGSIHGGTGTSGLHSTVQVTNTGHGLTQNTFNQQHNSESSHSQGAHQIHQETHFTGYPELEKPDIPFVTGFFKCHGATQICVTQDVCLHGFTTVAAGFLIKEEHQHCNKAHNHVCCSVKYQQETQHHETVVH
ncbi:hypothetical protein QAD02_024253, partial [Eretmocerus hayati]